MREFVDDWAIGERRKGIPPSDEGENTAIGHAIFQFRNSSRISPTRCPPLSGPVRVPLIAVQSTRPLKTPDLLSFIEPAVAFELFNSSKLKIRTKSDTQTFRLKQTETWTGPHRPRPRAIPRLRLTDNLNYKFLSAFICIS